MKTLKLFLPLIFITSALAQVTNPSGSVTISGSVVTVGNKSNNAVVPGSTNVGVLPCVATTAAPSYTTTFQVACSTDLSGNLRVVTTGSAANGAALAGSPVTVAVSDGANATIPQLCPLRAILNTSASGSTQIIAASGATTIRICHVSFSTVATEDVKLVYGTGADCVTSPTDMTGLYKTVQSFDFEYPFGSPLRAAASQAVCFNQSVAQAAGVTVIYGQN